MRKSSGGFTLIELMVTVSLLAILAAAVVPFVQVSAQRNKEQELKLALREVRSAIDAYKQAVDDGRITRTAEQSGYPPELQVLVDGVIDAKDPKGRKMYFLRRIPVDPLAEAGVSPAESWGLRSYASDADDPQPGDDVYDIYSLNEQTGLNGRPYKDW